MQPHSPSPPGLLARAVVSATQDTGDLQARLAAPGGKALCEQLLDALDDMHTRLRTATRPGLPRDQFAATSALAEAVLAARRVLEQTDAAA